MWIVPLSRVLDAHGLQAIKPFAFASTAVAAFVSPLFFGAMADRHASPVIVLRWVSLASAAAMALASTAMQLGWNQWLTLVLIQLYALCSSPTFSLASTIIFSRLADAGTEFGPIRALATLGWMAGCWLISLCGADTSTLAGFGGAVVWFLGAGVTFFLPTRAPLKSVGKVSWHERLGLDALTLLKNADHRVVFTTTAFLCIPIAAFYPYAPPHLRDLGFQRTTAWMSLGQVSEIISMFCLGALLKSWRLKWIFAVGLTFGVLRFTASALDTRGWLLMGVALHGCSFALVYTTAQIYLEQRVEVAWRARAQALMTLMNSGFGNLIGYLGTGWWFAHCTTNARTRWPFFWGGMAVLVGCVMIYFLAVYRGRKRKPLEVVTV
jgi:MFS family permease